MGFNSNITKVSLNETYNQLIDDVEKVYDLVVADMTITAGRMNKVSFSSSIFDNSLRIVIRETSYPNIELLAYLRPFSTKLWITLLIASIYASFLVFLLEHDQNEVLKDKSISALILKCIWYSVGTILGFGVDIHIRTAAGRILTIGLYILSLVLVAAYTANLASDLTLSKSKGIISGIDDIKNGKISFSRIGILINTSIEEFYLREISNSNRNFYPLKNEEEMYEKLLNHIIDASIMDSGVIEYSTGNKYCNLTLIGTDFDKNAFGIVFKKKWLYQHIRMYFISRRRTIENEVIPLNLLDMDVGFNHGKDRLFFNWPIIIEHRIDSRSPLYDMDKETIAKGKFEILLVLEGIIEPTGMITQARTSYMPEEIVWGARFQRMIHFYEDYYTIDYGKFNAIYKDNCTTNISARQIHEQQNNQN